MLKTVGRIYDGIVFGAVFLSGSLIAVGILLVAADVTVRFFGYPSLGFTVAFVEYILLYFVLLAAPYLVRERGHVLTEMVYARLPRRAQRVMEIFVYLVCITVSLIFAYVGADLLIEALEYGYVDERSIDIPYWCLYLFYPPCFLMIAIEFARFLFGVGSLYDKVDNPEAM
ncbi:TRAP transporter small permease [Pararhizobium mangrovi]|uniref:TRAP transporter small permease protein n=1 Tax=Pararhizobium mangrovi TaxID=2590452 RepID=A0A506U3M6_9HYPH|nr:TRAP transporter small permease subunit [Pararhizobium mangrovi]TPW28993.1 TRAP transporter small permease subunit [Pararhizobium mangrovi]